MSGIEFKGDTEKEKELNKEIFNCTLIIAQKDDEIRELKDKLQQKENTIKEVRETLKEGLEQFDIRRREEIYAEQYFENSLEILDKEK